MLAITLWAHSINLSAVVLLSGTVITFLLLKVRRLKKMIRRTITSLISGQTGSIDVFDLPNIVERINRKFSTVADHIQQLTSPKATNDIPADLVDDEVGKALLSVR